MDSLSTLGDIDWTAKQKDIKEQIIANFESLGLDGVVFGVGKNGKLPYGQIKKYFRENGDTFNGGSTANNGHSNSANTVEKFQYYYHPDHLGSSSYITDTDGEVCQHLEYFPFGETFVEQHHGHDKYSNFKFNGKELDEATGLYYYGARYYDPRISMWYGVDKLSDKYPSLSPYVYCANNPIIFIDPDGKKVVFAKGVSKGFKKAFAKSVQHLNKHGAGGMLAKLHASNVTYYIDETQGGSSFSRKTKTISWDPTQAVLTNEAQELSPTTILNHEVDHALQYDQNPTQQKDDGKIPDAQYGNKEEKRVIEGSEQKTAKKLGEIKEGEVTRKDHGGRLYETTSPTSTEWKNEIIITPKKDE